MKIKIVHIVAVALVLIAAIIAYESISSDICPYLTVSEITEDDAHVNKKVKVLGRVTNASTSWTEEGLLFNVTDGQATIAVTYTGSLAQSLKEGQEVGVIGVQNTRYHVTAAQLDIKCASKYE